MVLSEELIISLNNDVAWAFWGIVENSPLLSIQ